MPVAPPTTSSPTYDCVSSRRGLSVPSASERHLRQGQQPGSARHCGADTFFVGPYIGVTIHGGAGNDYLEGRSGTDWMVGESGDDTFSARSSPRSHRR